MTTTTTSLGQYTRLSSTGGDGSPTLEVVIQTAERNRKGQLIFTEEDEGRGETLGPYKTMARLEYVAARRRERLAVKEGEFEDAMAEYESRMVEEEAERQREVEAVIAQGLNALWVALSENPHGSTSEKLAVAILEKLGVSVVDHEGISALCGHLMSEDAPEGLRKIKAHEPARYCEGWYRHESRRGQYNGEVIGYHAAGGPLVFVVRSTSVDRKLTNGEGMTVSDVYGSPGSWFQTKDSGTGELTGCKFI